MRILKIYFIFIYLKTKKANDLKLKKFNSKESSSNKYQIITLMAFKRKFLEAYTSSWEDTSI